MFEMGWPPDERLKRATELIESVGLGHRPKHRPSQLSVGDAADASPPRALGNNPSLLLADEPTGNLDTKSQDEIIQLLHRLRAERGLTLVIVTHSQEVAKAADRQIQMRDARCKLPRRRSKARTRDDRTARGNGRIRPLIGTSRGGTLDALASTLTAQRIP